MALGTATVAYELRYDAGRVCLDLLATSHPEERFDSVEVLCAWITGAGLVPPGVPLTHADPSWLVDFRELRGQIGQLVSGAVATPPRPTYDIALPRAVRGEDGALVRELDGPPECAALLGAIARDAVELLTDPVARAGLRQCEGDNCPIFYVDSSRGRRRRWCSSEVCGNRERVARHRRRAALARA